MLIAVAVIGWILFAFVALLYWVGMRRDAAQMNSIQFLLLATLVSKEYWEKSHEITVNGLAEMSAQGHRQRDAIYATMGSLLVAAQNTTQENLGMVLGETQTYFAK